MINFKKMKLWEICTFDRRFNGVEKEKQKVINKFKHISASKLKEYQNDVSGEVRLLSTGNFEGYTKYNKQDKNINCGEVITIPTGGTANLKYHKGYFVDSGNILLTSSIVNLKYVYYYLTKINEIIQGFFRGAGVQHPSMPDILELDIPIPAMEVQNKIVEVLDKFSALEAELEAELEARTKQYEYYKSKLIFSENKRLILSKLSRYSNTRISSEELTFSNYVGVDNLLQSKLGKVNSKYEPMIGSQTEYVAGDILIGNIRPYLRKIWYSDIRGGTNGDVLVIRVLPKMKNVIMDKFLYYVLSSEEFFYYMDATSKGAKMPRGDKNMIMQFEIPIPPLEEQERIVSILDKFSTLVTNIKEGLPAEIELRRKQYEYYRNKLLTFDKE